MVIYEFKNVDNSNLENEAKEAVMQKIGKLLLLVSLGIFGVYFYLGSLDAKGPEIPPVLPTPTTITVTETSEPVTNVAVLPTLVPTEAVEIVSQPVSVFNGYQANGVDLDSGKPIAIIITTSSGEKIVTTWAQANGPAMDPGGVKFQDPHSGTVFTIKAEDGTPVMFVHSGQVWHKWVLFGSTLDWYARHDSQGNEIRLSDALAKVEAMRGSTAVLCQVDSPKDFPIWFDGYCQGIAVNLKVSAAALVLEGQVDQYSEALSVNPIAWLTSMLFDPRTGKANNAFMFINPNNGFLLSTCVQRYPIDEAANGRDDVEFNRLAIWFEFE